MRPGDGATVRVGVGRGPQQRDRAVHAPPPAGAGAPVDGFDAELVEEGAGHRQPATRSLGGHAPPAMVADGQLDPAVGGQPHRDRHEVCGVDGGVGVLDDVADQLAGGLLHRQPVDRGDAQSDEPLVQLGADRAHGLGHRRQAELQRRDRWCGLQREHRDVIGHTAAAGQQLGSHPADAVDRSLVGCLTGGRCLPEHLIGDLEQLDRVLGRRPAGPGDQPVGVEQQQVPGRESAGRAAEGVARPQGSRAGARQVRRLPRRGEHERRRVARRAVGQVSRRRLEHAGTHRRAAGRRHPAGSTVQQLDRGDDVAVLPHALLEQRPQLTHRDRRLDPPADDVPHDQHQPPVGQHHRVEPVAARGRLLGEHVARTDLRTLGHRHSLRQQSVLELDDRARGGRLRIDLPTEFPGGPKARSWPIPSAPTTSPDASRTGSAV